MMPFKKKFVIATRDHQHARCVRSPKKCKKCLAMALGIVKNGVILRSLGTNYAKI
jgi:hypothetical protein